MWPGVSLVRRPRLVGGAATGSEGSPLDSRFLGLERLGAHTFCANGVPCIGASIENLRHHTRSRAFPRRFRRRRTADPDLATARGDP